jgi:hypothetical protein
MEGRDRGRASKDHFFIEKPKKAKGIRQVWPSWGPKPKKSNDIQWFLENHRKTIEKPKKTKKTKQKPKKTIEKPKKTKKTRFQETSPPSPHLTPAPGPDTAD